MPMTPGEIAAAPRHPQLMDPVEDPEKLIEASIWWYPTLFPHRTAVLQHLLLCAGNGYDWNDAGQICSVFAHLPPDYKTLEEHQARSAGWVTTMEQIDDPSDTMAAILRDEQQKLRKELEAEAQVRATATERTRTHGPVTTSRGRSGWGLMAMRPEQVEPRWQALLDEAGHVFARAQAAQDAAVTRLRRQWDRNPAARAAQLLTRQLGRAFTADRITDAELETCDRLLATWRDPAWAARLDRPSLHQERDRNRELTRRIRAELSAELDGGNQPDRLTEQTAERGGAAGSEPRNPVAVLIELATDRLYTLSSLVRPAPFTAWQEWDWTLDLVRQQLPVAPMQTDDQDISVAGTDFNSGAGYKALPLRDGIAGPWGHKVLREDGSLAGYAGYVSWRREPMRVYSADGADLDVTADRLEDVCEELASRDAGAAPDEHLVAGILHGAGGYEAGADRADCEPEL